MFVFRLDVVEGFCHGTVRQTLFAHLQTQSFFRQASTLSLGAHVAVGVGPVIKQVRVGEFVDQGVDDVFGVFFLQQFVAQFS